MDMESTQQEDYWNMKVNSRMMSSMVKVIYAI